MSTITKLFVPTLLVVIVALMTFIFSGQVAASVDRDQQIIAVNDQQAKTITVLANVERAMVLFLNRQFPDASKNDPDLRKAIDELSTTR